MMLSVNTGLPEDWLGFQGVMKNLGGDESILQYNRALKKDCLTYASGRSEEEVGRKTVSEDGQGRGLNYGRNSDLAREIPTLKIAPGGGIKAG